MVTRLPPFVTPSWLAANRDDVCVVDCRWSLDGSAGRLDHLAGHLPGAVFADLDVDLAGAPGSDGRHPLPDPDDFALAMQRLGLHDDTPVVAYDTSGGAIAARLVWMLRIVDHPAAVLDGGPADFGSVLEEGEVDVEVGSFRPRPWPPAAVATVAEVGDLAGRSEVLVDARAPARFRGDHEPVDAVAGHVPGARNLPATSAVRDGRLRPDAELWAQRAAVGVEPGDAVVWSCGSGVTACHGALVDEHLSGVLPRVFVGSWSAWTADSRRPIATGPSANP